MPQVDPVVPNTTESDGPAAQKPDMKLSPDALRAGAAKPLSEHLRKHEKRKQTDDVGPSGTVPPRETEVPGADKGRRRGRADGKEGEKKFPDKDKMA